MGGARPRSTRSRLTSGRSELDIDRFKHIYKGRGGLPDFLSRCAAHPSSSPPPPKLQAWCRRYLLFLTRFPITMFSKTALASLLLGVLYANALTIPVAREPAPEPECEFP